MRTYVISKVDFQDFLIRYFVLITFPDFLKDEVKTSFYIFLSKADAWLQINNSLSSQAWNDIADHFCIWHTIHASYYRTEPSFRCCSRQENTPESPWLVCSPHLTFSSFKHFLFFVWLDTSEATHERGSMLKIFRLLLSTHKRLHLQKLGCLVSQE